MIGVIAIWNVAFVFANLRESLSHVLCVRAVLTTIVECIPIEANWQDVVDGPTTCVNLVNLFFALVLTDILSDGRFYILFGR